MYKLAPYITLFQQQQPQELPTEDPHKSPKIEKETKPKRKSWLPPLPIIGPHEQASPRPSCKTRDKLQQLDPNLLQEPTSGKGVERDPSSSMMTTLSTSPSSVPSEGHTQQASTSFSGGRSPMHRQAHRSPSAGVAVCRSSSCSSISYGTSLFVYF